MDSTDDCKRHVEGQLEINGFSGCHVDAVRSGDQIIVKVTTADGRTAEAGEDLVLKAIWQAKQDRIPLEEEFENRNMYAPPI